MKYEEMLGQPNRGYSSRNTQQTSIRWPQKTEEFPDVLRTKLKMVDPRKRWEDSIDVDSNLLTEKHGYI